MFGVASGFIFVDGTAPSVRNGATISINRTAMSPNGVPSVSASPQCDLSWPGALVLLIVGHLLNRRPFHAALFLLLLFTYSHKIRRSHLTLSSFIQTPIRNVYRTRIPR